MRTNIIVGTLAVVTLVAVNFASAQSDSNFRTPQQPIYSPPVWMHHSSTVAEGTFRGWADARRAMGEFNYNTSLALINAEEARRLSMQNHKQFVQDYFEKKDINRAARFGDQASRPSQADLARYSQERLPERLASYEYHRVLGKVVWPAAFQGAQYAKERAAIDHAIAQRTVDNSGVGSGNYERIKDIASRMESTLKSEVHQLTTSESIAARKFLKSLSFEARFPLGADVSGLAAR